MYQSSVCARAGHSIDEGPLQKMLYPHKGRTITYLGGARQNFGKKLFVSNMGMKKNVCFEKFSEKNSLLPTVMKNKLSASGLNVTHFYRESDCSGH